MLFADRNSIQNEPHSCLWTVGFDGEKEKTKRGGEKQKIVISNVANKHVIRYTLAC